MRKVIAILGLLFAGTCAYAAQPGAAAATTAGWRAQLATELPLLGHRNWILIVDSAYPLQVSPGVETIETGANQLFVLHTVLSEINRSIHVRPDIFMDAELPYVPDNDAPGASAYRSDVATLLSGYTVQSMPHAKLLDTVAQAGEQFHILVLKTTMAVPYSSVFIRLNCRYWGDDAEARLRQAMAAHKPTR